MEIIFFVGRYLFLLILVARFCTSLPNKERGSGLNVTFLGKGSETFKGPVGDTVMFLTPTGEYALYTEEQTYSYAIDMVAEYGGALLGQEDAEQITSVAIYLNAYVVEGAETVWASAEEYREDGCQIIKFSGIGGYNIEKSDCDAHHATLYTLEPK